MLLEQLGPTPAIYRKQKQQAEMLGAENKKNCQHLEKDMTNRAVFLTYYGAGIHSSQLIKC